MFFVSNVLVYRLGGSTYECSILRTIGGCFQTIESVYGFENSGDVFTDLLTDLIAEEFQKYKFYLFIIYIFVLFLCLEKIKVIQDYHQDHY